MFDNLKDHLGHAQRRHERQSAFQGSLPRIFLPLAETALYERITIHDTIIESQSYKKNIYPNYLSKRVYAKSMNSLM